MIQLTVNGQPKQFAAPLSIEALLQQLQLDPARVAVERNLEVLPREHFATLLAAGDQLEIVQFVGGG